MIERVPFKIEGKMWNYKKRNNESIWKDNGDGIPWDAG